MLWIVDRTQLALLGSIHMLDVPDPPLSDAAWRVFDSATRVALEHDLAQLPDMSFARLPRGQSLRDVVPPVLFAAVEHRCRDLLLSLDAVLQYQPWFAGIILGVHIALKAGLSHATGVDKKLSERAREQGKASEYLEECETALRAFPAAPFEEHLTMLRLPASDPEVVIAFMRRLVDGWKQGRADILLSCLNQQRALMPVTFTRLVEARNRIWLPRLLEMAQESRATLAVVGAFHTVGPTGLPALLRAEGYNVRAVDVSGE